MLYQHTLSKHCVVILSALKIVTQFPYWCCTNIKYQWIAFSGCHVVPVQGVLGTFKNHILLFQKVTLRNKYRKYFPRNALNEPNGLTIVTFHRFSYLYSW